MRERDLNLTLDLKSARAMIDAAFDYAHANGWIISVAVVDAGGNLIQASRMDGCNFVSPDIARGKAFGAAAWKEPSDRFGRRLADNPGLGAAMIAASGGRLVPVRGGLPIFWDGVCVGGIGASGARSQQDEACVRTALQLVGFGDVSP